MDVEDRIREAVREDLRPEPSLQFHGRVMAALPDGRTAGVAWRLPRLSMRVLQVGALALAAVLVVAVTLGPRMLPVAGPNATTSQPGVSTAATTAPPSPTPTASPSPSPVRQTIAQQNLSLTLPAGWTGRAFGLPFGGSNLTQAQLQAHEFLNGGGFEPLATAGTGSLEVACANPTAKQVAAGQKSAICTSTWVLPVNGVQLRLEYDNRASGFDGCCTGVYNIMTAISEAPPAASEAVMVGGLQARLTRIQGNKSSLTGETIPGADEILIYRLVEPKSIAFGYVITVALRGPDLAGLETQATEAMAGLRYTPEIMPMPTDPASLQSALSSTLALIDRLGQLPGDNGSSSCFLDTPGVANTATISDNAFQTNRKMLHSLKVRCTATIEPTLVDQWLVKLKYEWDATGGYRAGTATATLVISRDFQTPMPVAPQIAPTNEDAMPYIAPAHAYNPG